MQYTTLGRTNLKVSRIGFGAWGIGGGAPILHWEGMWKARDEVSQRSLIKSDKGRINFFDTALEYGNGHSEKLIAHVLGDKKDIIIATKIPPLDGHWPARNRNINKVFPKEWIIKKARESYKNLGRRTIDILQLHVWLDDWYDSKTWREAFKELKRGPIQIFWHIHK